MGLNEDSRECRSNLHLGIYASHESFDTSYSILTEQPLVYIKRMCSLDSPNRYLLGDAYIQVPRYNAGQENLSVIYAQVLLRAFLFSVCSISLIQRLKCI
jgi:hypothetical protein